MSCFTHVRRPNCPLVTVEVPVEKTVDVPDDVTDVDCDADAVDDTLFDAVDETVLDAVELSVAEPEVLTVDVAVALPVVEPVVEIEVLALSDIVDVAVVLGELKSHPAPMYSFEPNMSSAVLRTATRLVQPALLRM